jgi:hypothetical protein
MSTIPIETVITENRITERDAKLSTPVRSGDTESFLAAIAGTLSEDFPNEITDDDLGTDVPRYEWG